VFLEHGADAMLSIMIMMPQYTGHGTRVTRDLIEYGADKNAILRASGLRVSSEKQ
jgi:hypothetical protein